MKHAKKLFSLALALIMALALAVPAMAATGEYSITINDAQTGKTYEAYQIFAGTWSETAENLVDITWGDGVNGAELLADLKSDEVIGSYFTGAETAKDVADVLSGQTTVFSNDNAAMQAFADVVGANLTNPAGSANTNANERYVISNIASGYYLVKNSAVADDQAQTRFIIEVVDDAVATPKSSDIPDGEKTVGEDAENVGTYDIGDSIPFQLTIKLPDAGTMNQYDTYYLQLKDTMSTGLSYNSDAKVYFSEDATLDPDGDENITEYFTAGTEDGATFSLTCNDIKAIESIEINGGETIYVTYSATLTEDAPMASAIKNKFEYTYSNNPNGSGTGDSTPDETEVYTYQLTVTKTDGETDANLMGAEFQLKLDGVVLKFSQKEDGTYIYDADGAIDTLSTTWNGSYKAIVIKGLAGDVYSLVETKAPDGYNLLTAPREVIVGVTSAENDTLTTQNTTIDVDNEKGAQLPGTGGMGTTIFYVVGGVLMAGAAVLLVTKKKMSR